MSVALLKSDLSRPISWEDPRTYARESNWNPLRMLIMAVLATQSVAAMIYYFPH